ncbi:MFS-type transporter SLC18B1-like [Pollicipes pollicipes]|uniref:MFS-type transporter SLC18B1-like n=1 Tax=Pollicipes pollicipes TaxID=41117 RepID=UPI0018851B12|nr:MFS-type transporter SLC18B1-like [Pollicipes pollicipes]
MGKTSAADGPDLLTSLVHSGDGLGSWNSGSDTGAGGENGGSLAGLGYQTFGDAPAASGAAKRTYSWRQKLLMLVFSMGSLLAGSCLAMMIPFFPLEAQRRGISQTLTSGVFSIFSFTQLVTYPVIGRLVPRVGINRLYCIGMSMTAVSNIVFGLLFRLESATTFIAACYTVRVFEAIGTAAVITTALTMAANQFAENTSTAVAVMETMNAIGLSLGAAIGAGLYSLGGFGLPFFSQGCFILALVVLSVLYLPEVAVPRRSSGDFWAMLRTFASAGESWLCCAIVFTAAATWTAIDSSIARYASDAIGTTPAQIGLYFLVATGAYALSSLVWGRLADRLHNTYVMIAGCLFATALGLALIPPLPGLGLTPSWWLLGLGLTIKEIFQGGAYVPVLNRMIATAVRQGLPADVTTQAFTCSVFGTVASVGNVLGPVTAGAIIDARNFTFMVGCLATLASLVGVTSAAQAARVVRRRWSDRGDQT